MLLLGTKVVHVYCWVQRTLPGRYCIYGTLDAIVACCRSAIAWFRTEKFEVFRRCSKVPWYNM